MKFFATRRALATLAVWTGSATLATAAPAALPALGMVLAAVAAIAVWDLLALLHRSPATIARRLPERAHLGREAELALVVSNASPRDVRIDVFEELPRDLASRDPAFAAETANARETLELPYRVRPRLRGDRPLGQAVLLEHSPLGFFVRRTLGATDDVLPVYPDSERYIHREALDPRHTHAFFGIKRSRQRGEGMDFESLREYVVGDDPRRIDWAATARRGHLITRVHQHERNHTVIVAIDASRLMAALCGRQTKLDHAVDAALALGVAALAHGDQVEIVVFDREVRGHAVPRGRRAGLGAAMELLRHVQPSPVEPDYANLMRTLVSRRRQRKLVVVLTDFGESSSARIEEPVAALARRQRTLLIALRDPVYREIDPAETHPAGRGVFRRLVLDDLQRDRETLLARLQRQGVQTLDLPPESIIPPLLNRYLALRYGADR